MNRIDVSRRQMLLATTGIAVTAAIGQGGDLLAQSQDPLGKELIFRTNDPRNGEPSLVNLVQSWLTPVKHFYVRSHAPNPKIDLDQFRLEVTGAVTNPKTFSFGDLAKMPSQTMTATMTCAGNRRAEFNEFGKVGGVQWTAGAIGNATWTGYALADLLEQVGIQEQAKHVWFEGLDQIQKGGTIIPFGGSIPIEKAMIKGNYPGAMLAYQMNGKQLTPDHGFPLRTVVPGYIGARSVKWLGKIIVSDQPSPNHYLATAYKLVKKTDPIDWTESGPIYRYPINGAIAPPESGIELAPGPVDLKGYVLPTGRPGSKVSNVVVSSDDGKSWTKANLVGGNSEYCWRLWEAKAKIGAGTTKILLRAQDSSGGFMPYRVPWNAKGYLQNSWYKLPVKVTG
ncbi:MAG: molybdopterin-dependent oxidoreductase [Planctomycetota bacterium]